MNSNYWWKSAKFYELYIDKFAGNIQNLTNRLDYFNLLGVTSLHLLPHFPSPMIDDGYDIVDYRDVRPELGTLSDFAYLIQEAHARNIRIVIDFVLNHTSNQHPWFLEARSSKHNPKRDFYLWSNNGTGFGGALNAFPDIKPQNWIANPDTDDYYFATFYPQQPDLNWDNPEVMDEMMANMEFWANMGVDGFRLDAAPFLIKREGTTSRGLPETHAVLKRIRARLESRHPNVILLAEAHLTVELTKHYFGEGDECHMAYHFPLNEQAWLAFMFNEPRRITDMIENSFNDIPDNCQWATFLRNHDEVELTTIPTEDRIRLVNALDPEYRYLFKKGTATCTRIATAVAGDVEKIKTAIDLLYALPGTPFMYYGDEIGMRNLPLQEDIVDTRKYVRGDFDWSETEEQIKNPSSLFNQISSIIKGSQQNFLSREQEFGVLLSNKNPQGK